MPKCVVALYGFGNVAAFLSGAQAMFPDEPIEDDELQFLREAPTPTNHTHVISFNAVQPTNSAHVPRSRAIALALEPHQFLHIGHRRGQQVAARFAVFVTGLPLQWIPNARAGFSLLPCHVPRCLPSTKQQRVSIIVSEKSDTAGHQYRHALAVALLQDSRNLPVDVFGRGCKMIQSAIGNDDARVKGGFVDAEPFAAYMFTVAIENCQEGHYFTEKVSGPIFCACTPLYLGSPFISTYFPGATYALSGNVKQDVELVAKACSGALPPRDTARAKRVFQSRWHWGRYVKKLFAAAAAT